MPELAVLVCCSLLLTAGDPWFIVTSVSRTVKLRSALGVTMSWRKSGNMEKTQVILESTLESVDKAEAMVIREANRLGFEEDEQQQIGMAIRECTVNAVVHGNRYSKHKKVHLDIEPSKEGLAITIGDEGGGFDLNSLPDPLAPENLLRQSGRGLLLIRAFMDEFDLHERPGGGTEVRLVKHLVKS